MRKKTRDTTPLRMAIDVECARREWNFSDLTRAIQELGHKIWYSSLNQRVNMARPTKATLELVACGFGVSLEQLLTWMTDEAKAALKSGRTSVDRIEYVDPEKAIINVWRSEDAA